MKIGTERHIAESECTNCHANHCQATWFGLQSFPEPREPRKEAS